MMKPLKRDDTGLTTHLYISTNVVTSVFASIFELRVCVWSKPHQVSSKTPSVLQRQSFNLKAAICGHHKVSVQTSEARNPNLRTHIWHDGRVLLLHKYMCAHAAYTSMSAYNFQHEWTEQSECDRLSDATALYIGEVELWKYLQRFGLCRGGSRLMRINILLTGCLWWHAISDGYRLTLQLSVKTSSRHRSSGGTKSKNEFYDERCSS